MSLSDHARAADILGDAFETQAGHRSDSDGALMLMSIATAYRVAAEQMHAQARADIAAIGGGCTLDHSHLKGPTKCVCGASAANR